MDKNKLNEHIQKEFLKRVIDTGPNYTDKQKKDLKTILDSEQTVEEILKEVLTYFAMQ